MSAESSFTDFHQMTWDAALETDALHLLRLALREDLGEAGDLTTQALIDPTRLATARIVSRESGVVSGLPIVELVCGLVAPSVRWKHHCHDGDRLTPQTVLTTLEGSAAEILVAERTILNMLGRMCGISTLTRRFVDEISGTHAAIYDTRKTTPGWRRLEKYAVKQGGGRNHRTGLFDAILIKDNHIAQRVQARQSSPPDAANAAKIQSVLCEVVEQSRTWFHEKLSARLRPSICVVEIEVDALDQYREVLPSHPDIILLDNMTLSQLREAVALRDVTAAPVQLEASGGVRFDTVRAIAETGVDRISVGALTHSATTLDIGLDW